MKKKSRIVAICVSILLVFTMMPMLSGTVFAAGGNTALELGTDVLEQNVNTAGAQTVWYANKAWRVIGYDGSGAASIDGAATLLAADTIGMSKFDASGSNSNTYADSTLKAATDAIADDVSDKEQRAIVKKTLAHGTWNGSDTDCIAGEADITGVVLWPLSIKEATNVDETLRIVDPENTIAAKNFWWLCSPGFSAERSAIVLGKGYVYCDGQVADNEYGVRPAFYLDLNAVLFTSAAEGGKASGDADENALTEISDNSTDEWKLTLKDEDRGFAMIGCEATENGFKIRYKDAKTGDNEYISAVIKDSDGNITYYGRIAKVSAAGANGEITINTDGKLRKTDTLYVFNEQLNGDRSTDYASPLQKVIVSQTIIASNVTKTYGDPAFSLGAETSGDGTLTYKSSNTKVVTVSSTGKITIKGAGTAKITISASATEVFSAASKTITITIKAKKITPKVTLSASSYTYDGTVKKPTVTVKSGSTKLAASQYTVTYKNNKNVGKASVTVTLKGNYSGSKTVTFKINPKGTSLKTLTKASKAVTVKWTKQAAKMAASRITGYQIQLSTDKNFTKNKTQVTVKGYSKVSKKVTGLLGGKMYYIRIRTYKTIGGTNYYSPWSKVKTVTTKK